MLDKTLSRALSGILPDNNEIMQRYGNALDLMKTLLEIEAAIKQLPTSDVRQLASWLRDYLDDEWDQQIQADWATGKLDCLIAKAESDIEANRLRALDEVLNNT